MLFEMQWYNFLSSVDTVSFSTTSEIMNFQSRQIMLRFKIINQEEVTLFNNEKNKYTNSLVNADF